VGISQGGVGPVARDGRAVLGGSPLDSPLTVATFCMPSPSPHRGRTSGQQPIVATRWGQGPSLGRGKGAGGGSKIYRLRPRWSFGGALVELCIVQSWWSSCGRGSPPSSIPAGGASSQQIREGVPEGVGPPRELFANGRRSQAGADSRRQVLIGVM
jgi:hypothetical protein